MENQTYEDFVASRVKWMGELPADLVHAGVGILGELIELRSAMTRENLLEELADLEFYCVHYQLAWQRSKLSVPEPTSQLTRGATCIEDCLSNSIYHAGELLDAAKKMWVYRKPPSELYARCNENFWALREALVQLHWMVGTNTGSLRANNEAKLRTRYPVGYSDAHAQLRMDKQPGE